MTSEGPSCVRTPARVVLSQLASNQGKVPIRCTSTLARLRRERPGHTPASGLREKSREFNILAGVDLKVATLDVPHLGEDRI